MTSASLVSSFDCILPSQPPEKLQRTAFAIGGIETNLLLYHGKEDISNILMDEKVPLPVTEGTKFWLQPFAMSIYSGKYDSFHKYDSASV